MAEEHGSVEDELRQALDMASVSLRGRLTELPQPVTAEWASRLAGCPWDGDCFPACPHCSATSDEIDAALALHSRAAEPDR